MKTLSRQRFLSRLGTLSAAASLTLPAKASLSVPKAPGTSHRAPDLQFPTIPRDRIAVSSWPFRAYIESPTNPDRKPGLPGIDLKHFAAHVVKEFNIRNIEPIFNQFRSTAPEYLRDFREAVEKAGSHVVDIPVDTEDSLYDPDPAVRNRAVEFGKKWVDIAAGLGASSIRNGIARAKNASPNVHMTAEELHKISEPG